MQCKTWHSLPRAGGLLDQPARLMLEMTVSVNVYQAIKSWRRANNWAEFAKRNPETWEIVIEMLELERWSKVAGSMTGMMARQVDGRSV